VAWLQIEQREVLSGINELRSLIERLELLEDGERLPETVSHRAGAVDTGRVFVVHGRDEGLRDQVARLITALGLDPMILAERTNEGRTVIEKFEGASDVGFAVVILSAEDFGRGPDDPEWPARPNRARQNVILELGYFIGRLGRGNVAALYREGTELPTDFLGTAYTRLDDADWRFRLARELKAAGFDVDLNALA
jgi:predicted nucleotide-binding protein